MKDFLNRDIHKGDYVAFAICKSTKTAHLYCGQVTDFVNRSGYECAHISYFERYAEGVKQFKTINLSSRKLVKLSTQESEIYQNLINQY